MHTLFVKYLGACSSEIRYLACDSVSRENASTDTFRLKVQLKIMCD